jgi:hypothetical protein
MDDQYHDQLRCEKMLTLLDFENAILDLFEKNRITIQDAKVVLWTLLTAIYEDELVEEPERREIYYWNDEFHYHVCSMRFCTIPSNVNRYSRVSRDCSCSYVSTSTL